MNKHIQVSFRVVNGKPVQMGLSVLGKKKFASCWLDVTDVAPMLREIEKCL